MPLRGVVSVSAGVCLSQGFGLLSESLTGGHQCSPLVDEAVRVPLQALARLLQLSSVLSMRHANTPSWGERARGQRAHVTNASRQVGRRQQACRCAGETTMDRTATPTFRTSTHA